LLDEVGVAAAPGVDFDPVDGHRFIRFSFAGSTAAVEGALEALERFLALTLTALESAVWPGNTPDALIVPSMDPN
jgi:hypothetical protein